MARQVGLPHAFYKSWALMLCRLMLNGMANQLMFVLGLNARAQIQLNLQP